MSEGSLGLTGLLDELLAEQLDDGKDAGHAAPCDQADTGKGPDHVAPVDQPSSASSQAFPDSQPRGGAAPADAGRPPPRVPKGADPADAELEGLLSDIEQRHAESDTSASTTTPAQPPPPEPGVAANSARGGSAAAPDSGVAPTPPTPQQPELPPAWELRLGSATTAVVSHAEDPNESFRQYMEDGHKILEPLQVAGRGRDESWSYFAVFDGHGGRSEVDYCEQHFHETLAAELQNPVHKEDPCRALEATFLKIDSQLAMLGAWSSGCTVTVALLHRQSSAGGPRLRLHIANVGDSRAVLVGAQGAIRASKDHRPDDPSESKRVVAEGGRVHNRRVAGKLGVARSLGDHHLKNAGVSGRPDTFVYEVVPGHVLVMASDGLWDALGDQDAHSVLQACIDGAVEKDSDQQAVRQRLQDTAAQALVDRAKQLGSRDNILALVIFL